MGRLDKLGEHVDRLLLRHGELRRTAALLEQQLADALAERNLLRARLSAARSRIDTLLEQLPADPADGSQA